MALRRIAVPWPIHPCSSGDYVLKPLHMLIFFTWKVYFEISISDIYFRKLDTSHLNPQKI
jgi:hypothetical protein